MKKRAKPRDAALVQLSPSSLEKVEAGAKRILSGMVADTLALVKEESPLKREVHVLVAGAPEFFDCFSLIVPMADELLRAHFHFHYYSCQRMGELVGALKQRKFDLALVQLHCPPPAEHKFTDNREVLLRVETLIAENQYIVWAGLEVACFLHTVHGIPVVMVSDTGQEQVEKLVAEQVGARALFPWIGMDVQAFCVFLRGILLQIPSTPRISRPLRVVMVEDDPDLLEVYVETFRQWSGQVDYVPFDKPLKALEELEQRDPDLLITGYKMPRLDGEKLVQKLMTRNIKYPILVLSSNTDAQQWVDDYAGRGINVRYYRKPGSEHEMEKLRSLIGELLQIPLGSTREPAGVSRPPGGARRPRIIVVWSEEHALKAIELILRSSFDNVELVFFEDSHKAWDELSQTLPNLLLTYDQMPRMTGEEIVRRLAMQGVTFPMIVLSAFWQVTEPWVEAHASRGLNIQFLNVPFDVPTLRKAVATSLNIPLRDSEKSEITWQPGKTRPPRIVLVDDEDAMLDLFDLLIRDWFKDVRLLSFKSSSEALHELSQTDPDLLILDTPLTGMEILPWLAEEKAKYPILLTSGLYGEKEMRQHADPNLRVSCLVKPFSAEQLNHELLTHVGPSDNPQRKVWKNTP